MPDGKAKLKDFSKKVEGIFERHPTVQELIDLYEARLSDSRSHQVRQHVMDCGPCQSAFRQASDFFDPALEKEPVVNAEETERRLDRLWRSLPFEKEMHSMPRLAGNLAVWRTAALLAALASLLIAIGTIQLWQLYTRTESQLAAMQRHDASMQAQNQQRNQTEASSTVAALSQQLQQLQSPHLNVPVMEVFSMHERDSGQPQRPVLRVPSNAPIVVLVLNSESEDRAGHYDVEMVSARGESVWTGTGLERDRAMDRYTVTVPSDRLTDGDYFISVYSQSGNARHRIDQYSFRIVRTR